MSGRGGAALPSPSHVPHLIAPRRCARFVRSVCPRAKIYYYYYYYYYYYRRGGRDPTLRDALDESMQISRGAEGVWAKKLKEAEVRTSELLNASTRR